MKRPRSRHFILILDSYRLVSRFHARQYVTLFPRAETRRGRVKIGDGHRERDGRGAWEWFPS